METVVAIIPQEALNLSMYPGEGSISNPGGAAANGGYQGGMQNASSTWVNYTWIPHKTRPPEYLEYSGAGAVGLQVMAVLLVMTTAVFGNALMCYAVYKTPSLRTMANLFTINLGLSDLSLAIVVLPAWMDALVSGAANAPGRPPLSVGLCQAVAFVTVLLLLVSIATLAGISLDRYFIICHPLRYPMEITSRRVCSVLVYIWAQSTLLAAMPLMGWGVYDFRPQTIPICNPVWGAAPGHAVFLILVGMSIPFSVMIFSYTRVVQMCLMLIYLNLTRIFHLKPQLGQAEAARRQWARIAEIQRQLAQSSINAYGGSSSDEEDSTDIADVGRGFRSRPSIFRRLLSRKGSAASLSTSYSNIAKNVRTLKTIFIVVGVFFVCWGPYVVVQMWSANRPERPLPYLADLFTTLLAFTNSAINPFMFMLLNRDFRYALRLMVARLMQLMGEEEAVHKAKMAGHRDSMVESFRLHSRASVDSGVVMEMKTDPVLRPPPAAVPASPRDRMPDAYQAEGAGAGKRPLPVDEDYREEGVQRQQQQQHRWLLDAPIPHSYRSCEHGAGLLQPMLLTVPSLSDDDFDIRDSLRQHEPEGPTFIVPNGNIPIIVIGGDPMW